MATIKCKFCDNDFNVPNYRKESAKFCSKECKSLSERIRRTFTCTYCKEEFETNKKEQKFCNDTCRRSFDKPSAKKCEICNKNFSPKDSRTRTCSKKCHLELLNTQVEKKCLICDEKFMVSNSRKDKAKFCSQECYTESKKDKKTLNTTCDHPNCNNQFYKAPSLKQKHDYSYCSKQCYASHSSILGRLSGSNNPNWTGLGAKHNNKKYYGPNWYSQRRKVRERDNYKCQLCGIDEKQFGKQMSVHHIKPFVLCHDYLEANELSNLICYCEPCHRKIHSGINHPRNYIANSL